MRPLQWAANRVVDALDRRFSLSNPAQVVYRAAMSQAKRDVSDSAACEALREEIREAPSDAIRQELAFLRERSDYLQDRAYRLLAAASEGGAVAPVDPGVRVQFEQEAMLGHLPLPEAFRRLAEAEPELARLEEKALTGKKVGWSAVRGLVGEDARKLDPLLHHQTAAVIAMSYLVLCRRGRQEDQRSCFERRGAGSHHTVTLRSARE